MSELELAISYTQLGCTLAAMSQYTEAYHRHHLALTLRYRHLDFSHGLVAESLNYCAECLCSLDHGGEGVPLALHAVSIRKDIFGTKHPAYAHTFSVLASCYHSVGRYYDACDSLEQCLDICEVAFRTKNHANTIPNLININYARVLSSMGELAKAREVFQRAIAIHELNFKGDQKARQLEECTTEVCNLTEKIGMESLNSRRVSMSTVSTTDTTNSSSSVEKHLPKKVSPADIETKGTPVIIFTDIG